MQWLVGAVLNWLTSFVAKWVAKVFKQYEDEKAIDEKTKAAAEAEQKAKTKDELDKADSDVFSHL